MDIICFGQQNWDVTWTGKQHLVSRLALRGHRVLYIDPQPVETGNDLLQPARDPALRRVGLGELWVATLHQVPALGWRANQAMQRRQVVRAVRHLGLSRPTAFILHPDALPRLKAVDTLGVVYMAVDEYTEYGGLTDAAREAVRRSEDELLATAHVAFAVSKRLVERWRDRRPDAELLENASDTEHFAPSRLDRLPELPAIAALKGPVLGFFGQIDERLDQDLVLQLAGARSDWHVVLAGRVKSGVDVGRLERAANVHLIGFQRYEDLPALARNVDVWILPYRPIELARSCNPLKLFEYLATGKPVVATPLDGIATARNVVTLADDTVSFHRAVEKALANPQAGRAARLATAAANDWEARVDILERRLFDAQSQAAAERGRSVSQLLVVPARRAPAHWRNLIHVNEYGERRDQEGLDRLRSTILKALRAAGLLAWGGRSLARRLTGRRHPTVGRILVARHAYLGDLITLTPALAALRRAFPDARITLGVQKDFSADAILEGTGLVDEVLRLNFLWSADRLAETRGMLDLLGRGFDLVLAGSRVFFLSEAVFSGSPRQVGFYDGHPLQRSNGRAVPRELRRHDADNNLALVEAVTGPAPAELRRPRVGAPPDKVAASWATLEPALGLPEGARLLVVHPGSKKPTRRWPPESFAGVIGRMLERRPDLFAVISGTPGERDLAEAILAALPDRARMRTRSAVGASDLHGVVGLLGRADALLSNDTGVMHVARAVGTPLVAVVGPENERLWGPYPEGAAPAIVVKTQVPCSPCILHACTSHFCMTTTTIDRVAAAVADVLDQGRPAVAASVPVDYRLERRTWSALKDEGYALPTVSAVAVLDRSRSAAGIDRLLDGLALQNYPSLELVVVREPGAAPWIDRRDTARRTTMPVRVVDGTGDSAGMRAGISAARGDLIVVAEDVDEWSRWRVALDVAAAMRDPRTQAFRDGLPLRDLPADWATCGATVRRERLVAGWAETFDILTAEGTNGKRTQPGGKRMRTA